MDTLKRTGLNRPGEQRSHYRGNSCICITNNSHGFSKHENKAWKSVMPTYNFFFVAHGKSYIQQTIKKQKQHLLICVIWIFTFFCTPKLWKLVNWSMALHIVNLEIFTVDTFLARCRMYRFFFYPFTVYRRDTKIYGIWKCVQYFELYFSLNAAIFLSFSLAQRWNISLVFDTWSSDTCVV